MSDIMPMGVSDPRRAQPVTIDWTHDGIGRMSINGEFWAAVEWSEKRQAWCIEDAEGQCLSHAASIRGQATAKDEAVALAVAMICDGRLPSPQEAWEARRARREKRRNQPAQLRRAEERMQRAHERIQLSMRASDLRRDDELEPPLYEALATVFDFSDPELWKSNSFATLRPRLVTHVTAVIAGLEYDRSWRRQLAETQPFMIGPTAEQRRRAAVRRRVSEEAEIAAIEAKLARAREILDQLKPT